MQVIWGMWENKSKMLFVSGNTAAVWLIADTLFDHTVSLKWFKESRAGSERLNRWLSHCIISLNILSFICIIAQTEHWHSLTSLSAETVFSNQLNWPFVKNSAVADLIGTYFGVFSFSCRGWICHTHPHTVWLLMIKYSCCMSEPGWPQVKKLHFSR